MSAVNTTFVLFGYEPGSFGLVARRAFRVAVATVFGAELRRVRIQSIRDTSVTTTRRLLRRRLAASTEVGVHLSSPVRAEVDRMQARATALSGIVERS